MWDYVYTEHLKGRKVLLETPSGFAVFLVKEFAFQDDKNIWVQFSDPEYAIQALHCLGFRKIDNRSVARNCEDGPGEVLVELIKKFCRTGEQLIVQDKDLKASIEEKIGITCICDGYAVAEVMWGIKNVLHEFIFEEKCNITLEYCLPVSKGLREALQYYLVSIPPRKLDKSFISKFGFLCYLDKNLESFPKELSRSFDKYVGIGETIKDGLDYAKVLAMVLVPELVQEHDFSKTFSPDLTSKLHQAELFQAKRDDDLTMHDIEKIMEYLNYLLNVPKLRNKILMDVKLMEMTRFKSHVLEEIGLDALERVKSVKQQSGDLFVSKCIGLGLEIREPEGAHQPSLFNQMKEPVNFNNLECRKVLLETPSGFAVFNVHEDVFSCPELTWTYFSNIFEARDLVFALGFVSVDDKSVTRDSVIGPGDKLRQLILRFCNAEEELVVQDTELKAVIESKLGVKCWTGDKVVDEVMWGLKFDLGNLIFREKDKLTYNYYLPLSKQLLEDLKTYEINVSTREINGRLVSMFGDVKYLDVILKSTCKYLHNKCDCHVSNIGFEDDEIYASMIAKVLFPEFEIALPEIPGALESKLMDLCKYPPKAIADDDKQEILQCLKKLSNVCRKKKYAHKRVEAALSAMAGRCQDENCLTIEGVDNKYDTLSTSCPSADYKEVKKKAKGRRKFRRG